MFLIMDVDILLQVWHAGVSQFYSVPVDYFVQGVIFGEIFVQQLKELLPNFGLDICRKRGVKVDYSPFSAFGLWRGFGGCLWVILQLICVPTIFKGFLVGVYCLLKNLLA